MHKTIKYWYIPLIIGLIFIGVGIYTFMSPVTSYLTLALLFSLSFLCSGIIEIIFAISNRNEIDNWGWSLIFGIITSIFGVLLLINPEISIMTLPFYVGFLILFRSVGSISYALDLKNYGDLSWGNLMVFGVLGIIFSFILLWNPLFAGLNVVIWTGVSFLSLGIYSVIFSFKLKKLKDSPNKISDELKQQYESVKNSIQTEMNK
ncbi:HdeD family acid-resistance protein [Tamlana sp. 2_MG-2023]|uniref:HdeD family acid-resistance protein n=1 Tax=unclassified Tamlana TaxID=2614803 RepID=UPI0026E251BD|nr:MULTISPECIES: HdeD family acid-resistance protein [unclassified Tamlana]MDO6759791.1 HdeD family acid-resistance protein [Tamlana sp. 2_MG-2023]MDO6791414.1 HdeD family acid-resistance protein [Tamlana sp. 1_MG-2023]